MQKLGRILHHHPASFILHSSCRAPPAGVRRLVLVRGLRLAAAGVAIGLAAAAVFGRLLGVLLYGVHPLDPETLLLSTLLLLGLAALAAYVPARRAARMDPVDLLRAE